MPTLQERLETAVALAEADTTKLNGIVNGPASGAGSTVNTDGGPVDTIAKAVADGEAEIAASAAGLAGTSATSLSIGTGAKALMTQAGKHFAVGAWLLVTSDADAANYMHGQVTAYVGTDLTVNVTNVGGAGTFADWTIRVSGTRGAQGDQGIQGIQGPPGSGDVTGPAGAVVDNAIARWNGVGGSDIQDSLATIDDNGNLQLESLDAGASEGPSVTLYRNSASPADNDLIGSVKFDAKDESGNQDNLVALIAQIIDATDATEDALLGVWTRIGGALARRGYFGHGLVVGAPMDGDKGAGSINAEALYVNGAAIGGGGAPASVQVFTSSGTWTKPVGITKVLVEVRGGGGGGGSVQGTASKNKASGGGGEGGLSLKLIDVSAISSETVTVGAGGASDVTTGITGGTSSFDAHCSATGGAGGWGINSGTVTDAIDHGGLGGDGSGGNINRRGAPGDGGSIVPALNTVEGAVSGGGGGAGGANGQINVGVAGVNGGGGSGTVCTGAFDRSGGAGGAGYIIVWEYE